MHAVKAPSANGPGSRADRGRVSTISRAVVLALAAALLLPASAAAVGQHHLTSCNTDGSLSVEVCVTMDYNIKWNPSWNTYMGNVVQYRTKYTRLDNSINFTSGDTYGGVIGKKCNGEFLQNSQHWVRTPANGVTYSDVPPWSSAYTQLWTPASAFQKVTATLTWRRGTQTYTTSAVAQLPNDGGWSKSATC